jgi:hypothetical protein
MAILIASAVTTAAVLVGGAYLGNKVISFFGLDED